MDNVDVEQVDPNKVKVESVSDFIRDNQIIKNSVIEALKTDIDSVFDASIDTEKMILDKLGIHLYQNQIDTIRDIIDPAIPYIVVIESRGGGKTFSVACALLLFPTLFPLLPIGIFGPKIDQSARIIMEMRRILTRAGDKGKEFLKTYIESVSAYKIQFKNGSYVIAMSASDTAEIEGFHGIIIADEAQRISNWAFSERILPMLSWGGFTKLVKIGVPRGTNHFHDSFTNTMYKVLSYNWTQCPILLLSGYIEINGIKYPNFVIDRMSLNMKKRIFPNNPEMWEGEGDMDDEDFATQYLLEWIQNVSPAFSAKAKELMFNMEFSPEISMGKGAFEYYFGLDFAGSSENISVNTNDFTSLSIFKKYTNGIKHKVFGKEWQGDTTIQIDEIEKIIHPRTGVFQCVAGYGDRGYGAPMIDDLKKRGISIVGISNQSTDVFTGKNYKNAMCEHMNWEAENDRLKYPKMACYDRGNIFYKNRIQVECMEKTYKGISANAQINCPDDVHDDIVNSDLLSIYACDFFFIKEKEMKNKMFSNKILPSVVRGPRLRV